ncbi:MAG: bifunctional 4-hydroxy-2-oxoglutarate aldolase/2-dehydro-3-deoxy-phosphogluconate aldolase [Synergistaceae bacterium]|jgi:2-dehydro-3-deoxyphosphogluconate aldolase/(4S)-4-hydroxy-2-oxoglutarate aldolase|nr:bifunctional 4-hydroxy-2-oxoglutarate aldolase/2-dehydro-3-deoxy-phosphogluconate aldolase [Synergistaceae bacterium]
MNSVFQQIFEAGIVPAITLDSPDQAVPLGKALIDGGITVAEVTFRTAAAEESIKRLAASYPGLLLGAGTVTSTEQVDRAVASGAKFIVSPGFNPAVAGYCAAKGVPVLPGVNSPSQIEQAMELGLTVLKFFPAEQSGGIDTLKAFAGPYSGVSYVPTGGVNTKNLEGYLSFGKVLAVCGSWLTKPELLAAGRYDEVSRLCREAVLAAMGFTFKHVGVNEPDEAASLSDAEQMENLFGFPVKRGGNSNFAGAGFEFMNRPALGKNGHIAIGTINVDRAAAYLKRKGIGTLPGTEKRDASGSLNLVYLDAEIGGFAVHLTKK